MKLKELLIKLEGIAPFELAESWDNVGLLIGDPGQKVDGLLIALDPTEEILAEALSRKLNVIITHHPFIFRPLKAIRTDQNTGRFLKLALGHDIAVVGIHTNLDVIQGGVNDVLAGQLGIFSAGPIHATGEMTGGDEEIGFGRTGPLESPVSGREFLDRILDVLGLPLVRVAGRIPDIVTEAAVCGGSGSDLAEKAMQLGAQIYITGEVKHNVARWAEEAGFCVVDAGHYATENLVVNALAGLIEKQLSSSFADIPVRTTANQTNPFHYFGGEKAL